MKTEAIFTVGVALLSAFAGFLLAPGRELALMDIVLVKAVSVAVFLAFAFGLLFVLKGTKYDVLHDVFEEDKGGAAIFTGLLLVALAMVMK